MREANRHRSSRAPNRQAKPAAGISAAAKLPSAGRPAADGHRHQQAQHHGQVDGHAAPERHAALVKLPLRRRAGRRPANAGPPMRTAAVRPIASTAVTAIVISIEGILASIPKASLPASSRQHTSVFPDWVLAPDQPWHAPLPTIPSCCSRCGDLQARPSAGAARIHTSTRAQLSGNRPGSIGRSPAASSEPDQPLRSPRPPHPAAATPRWAGTAQTACAPFPRRPSAGTKRTVPGHNN